jgi:hypothetical protein
MIRSKINGAASATPKAAANCPPHA